MNVTGVGTRHQFKDNLFPSQNKPKVKTFDCWPLTNITLYTQFGRRT